MRRSKSLYLLLVSLVLAVYYIVIGIYLNKAGYYNQESLFYIEKARIILNSAGDRLKVMGLTSPLLPFYSAFIFTSINYMLAPLIASALGMAVLFNTMANTMIKKLNNDYYLLLLVIIFLFHPGILYAACSGKSIYLILLFFYLFFLNMVKFYNSNTTFHVSIASICFVLLVFCDYKFIWLALFFIPLVLAISIHTLNLSERESIFRLFLSFNNPSLRRKLINKTFSIYMIIFILPIASMMIYKMLNLTHANDANYFLESPYASWSVLADRIAYSMFNPSVSRILPEISILISLKAILYCPLIILALYLFKHHLYQILTLLTPFGLIEFLRIKYDKVYLAQQYFLIFLVLSLLCIIYKAKPVKKQTTFTLILTLVVLLQLYTGYIFLAKSMIPEEQNFAAALAGNAPKITQQENIDIAAYINNLPPSSRVLVDDAIAYPIVALTDNIKIYTLPYQESYLSAIESPNKYDEYMLVASDTNPVSSYTQLNKLYLQTVRNRGQLGDLQKIYQTDNWVLYRIHL